MRKCDGKDIIFLRANKDPYKTLETIILGLIIIVIFLGARETGKQVTSSYARTIVSMLFQKTIKYSDITQLSKKRSLLLLSVPVNATI
jgi:hypothetical protein